MEIKTIGIIGAGVMGQGVAHQFAKYNYSIILVDVSDEKLDEAKKNIRNITRLDIMLSKGHNPTTGDLLSRITFTKDLSLLSHADFIVENTTENLQVKEEVYGKLREICRPGVCVAVNTSAVSITKIGSLLKDAKTVLGIHFMNPVHLKPTVEVIRGYHTTEETIQTSLSLLRSTKMDGVVVNDYPGFISNRVLMLTINEAIFALQDGVAKVEDIDRIFKECFGHKMGPLETCDLIGCDTILYTLDVLFASYNDSKFRAAPLLKKMVDANLLGRKNGEGFYKYKASSSASEASVLNPPIAI